MRHPDSILKLFGYLVKLGLGPVYSERICLEIRDHWRDLVEEGRHEGLSEPAAAELADRKLGDLDEMALSLAMKVRQSRWGGRHPMLAFVLLPIPLFFVVTGLVFSLPFWIFPSLAGEGFKSIVLNCWSEIVTLVSCTLTLSLAAVALYICSLSRRCHQYWAFSFVGCVTLATQALCLSVMLSPPPDGSISWAYSTTYLDPWRASVPLFAWAVCRIWEVRKQKTMLLKGNL